MYTEAARQARVTGNGGNSRGLYRYRANPILNCAERTAAGLTERSMEAAKNLKFIPAMKDGKYVNMYIQLEYNFNLY